MINLVAILVALILSACVVAVIIGCRAILAICGDLERDRRHEYRHPRPEMTYEQRRCPAWIRDTRRAAK